MRLSRRVSLLTLTLITVATLTFIFYLHGDTQPAQNYQQTVFKLQQNHGEFKMEREIVGFATNNDRKEASDGKLTFKSEDERSAPDKGVSVMKQNPSATGGQGQAQAQQKVGASSLGDTVHSAQLVLESRSAKPPYSYFKLLNHDIEKISRETHCNWVQLIPYQHSSTAPLCAYTREQDVWISAMLEDAGRWETEIMSSMESLFALDPELNLIDIGANIGVFSVLAAIWGRKVVAVEANPNSANKLIASLSKNKFMDSVLVLNNAVSDEHTKLNMVVDLTNRGGSIMISSQTNKSRSGIPLDKRQFVHDIQTIYMDELLLLTPFKRAILKIDVEGFEAIAFRKSRTLFEKMSICYIFMEWHWLREEKKGGDVYVYKLLTGLGYSAYSDSMFLGAKMESLSEFTGMDVYWKKNKC